MCECGIESGETNDKKIVVELVYLCDCHWQFLSVKIKFMETPEGIVTVLQIQRRVSPRNHKTSATEMASATGLKEKKKHTRARAWDGACALHPAEAPPCAELAVIPDAYGMDSKRQCHRQVNKRMLTRV